MPRPKKGSATAAKTAVETATPVDLDQNYNRENSEKRLGVRLRGKTILPKPGAFSVQDDNAIKFWNWVFSFSDEQAGVAELRVYREWPVVDRRLIGERSAKCIEKLEGRPKFESAAGFEEWFLHCYGSGRYKVIANEKGVTGAIAMCKFTLEESGHPPRINPKELIAGHPENKGFIESMKHAGIIPWDDSDVPEGFDEDDNGNEEDDEDMIAAEVLRSQNEQTKQLTDKVIQMAENNNRGPDPEIIHAEQIGKMYQSAAQGAVEMIKTNAGPQLNPIEIMRAAKEMNTQSDPMAVTSMVVGILQTSNAQMIEMMQRSHEQTLELVRVQNQPASAPSSAVGPASPPKGELEALLDSGEKLQRLEKIFGGGSRSHSRDEEPLKPQGFFGNLMEYAAQNPQQALMGITTVMALATNLVLSFLGKGVSPEEAIRKATAAPDGAVPQGQQQQQQKPWQVIFVENSTGPFLSHLYGEGTDGYTFAEFVIGNGMGAGPTPDGRRTYDSIKEQLSPRVVNGQNVFPLFDLMRAYPPLWQRLADSSNPHVPANPMKLQKFFEEFFAYDDEIIRRADEEEKARPATNAPSA